MFMRFVFTCLLCMLLASCQGAQSAATAAQDTAAADARPSGEAQPSSEVLLSATPEPEKTSPAAAASSTTAPTTQPPPTETPVPAGLIQVDSLEQEVYPFVKNGNCSLAEAIYAANLVKAVDACAPGGPEQSVIELMTGTYRLTQIDTTPQQVEWAYSTTGTGNALPAVVRPLTLRGGGAVLSREDAAEPFRIFEVLYGTFTLENITLQGGEVREDDWGGAVLVQNASLVLDGVTIKNSRAENGGGVHLTNGGLIVRDSTFSGNTAFFSGGGLYAGQTKAEITGSQFIENTADGLGAGVYVEETFISVADCVFIGNRSESRGGGINLQVANATILRSQFYRNYAEISGAGVSGRNYLYEDDIKEAEADPFEKLLEMETYTLMATQVPGFRETLVAHPSGMYLQRKLDIQVHESCFLGNANKGQDRVNYSAAIGGRTASQNNYYGDPSGPSGMGSGTGESISAEVDYEPFLTAPPAHCDLSLAEK